VTAGQLRVMMGEQSASNKQEMRTQMQERQMTLYIHMQSASACNAYASILFGKYKI